MTLPSNESVEYDIKIEAVLALQNLAQLTAAANSFNSKIKEATLGVKSAAQQWGVSFEQAKGVLQGLDAKLSGVATSSTVFGGAGQAAWEKVGAASDQATQKVSNNSSKMVSNISAIRIAFGILISMLLHEVLQAFTSMISGAINGLRELEVATYNLINAEEKLSKMGIDITPQGLDETIRKLQVLDPLLSKQQATEVVSRVATNIAPNTGFDAKQVSQLSEAIAILAIRNKALGYSFEEVEKAIGDAFTTGKVSQGINKFGIALNDQIVREEALRLGLVKTGDEFDRLSGKTEKYIKSQAMLSLLVKNTDMEREGLGKYFETADAKIGIFQARLADFLSEIGTILGPAIAKLFEMLADGLASVLEWIDKNRGALTLWGVVLEAFVEVGLKGLGLIIKIMGAVNAGFVTAINTLQKLIDKYPGLKKLADAWGFLSIGKADDTSTGNRSGGNEDGEAQSDKYAEDLKKTEDKIADAMKDARDKRLDIERDYQRKLQDIARDAARKLADIARNVLQKTEDANRDYAEKVDDINRDAEQKKEDARRDAQRREQESEQQHQNALRDLQRQYLFDLEEALHERDARQILRLMRQYQMDREGLNERREQERASNAQDLAEKLAEIERDKQIKLEAARRELEEKLRDIQIYAERERQDAAIAHARALQDARIAHNRALAENREYLQRKLNDIAAALAAEYNMTAQGASAIANLLGSYFGSGGVIDGIMSQLQGQMNLQNIATTPTSGGQLPGIGSGLFNPYDIRTRLQQMGLPTTGLAEGGSFLATRPQTIGVAENQPELITATPLGRPGADINKLFLQSGIGGGDSSGVGGSLELELTLSQDLEARIIRKSLDNAANVVMKVNRSKVR